MSTKFKLSGVPGYRIQRETRNAYIACVYWGVNFFGRDVYTHQPGGHCVQVLMKSTQDFRRNSDFRENDTYDLIATTMIGGATWRTPSNARVHRSIVYEFKSNPLHSLGEIAFGAKSDLKT